MIKDRLGLQINCDLYKCRGKLGEPEYLKDLLREAITHANATLVNIQSYLYEEDQQEIEIIARLKEGHAYIHTFPQFRTILIGIIVKEHRINGMQPDKVIEYLKTKFEPGFYATQEISRGDLYLK